MLACYKVYLCVLAAWCAGMAGCASVGPAGFSTTPDESPSRATLLGDWNDLEAALIVAASKAEMAVMLVSAAGESEFRAQLTTVTDEKVSLAVSRVVNEPERLEASCRVGHFGDAEAERRLLGHLARRLAQLRGREWAPVR